MFVFDVETLGIESTTVVLSAAMVHFELDKDFTYQDLLDNSVFVKFDAKEQIQTLKRTMTKSTQDWWNTQELEVKRLSLYPSSNDLKAVDGIQILRDYADKYDIKRDTTIWARGSLDQVSIDSLTRVLGQEDLFPYYRWRDVRTAIDLLKDTAKNGYCKVQAPGFNSFNDVVKHNPIHDCAYDAMMIKYGI